MLFCAVPTTSSTLLFASLLSRRWGGDCVILISMKESSYEIGTDEVAVKLGLSPRSVRRLGEKGILEGRVETTSVGKQWFFSRESVESLAKAYEVKRQKEERHRTAKDAFNFSNVHGQPKSTEDTSEVSRTPPMSDEKRVKGLEDLLKQEQLEHAQTRGKLESKEADLLEVSKQASRLEGEKEAYGKYADEMRKHQKELMETLRDTLRLAQPSATDSVGHVVEDNRGRVGSAEITSEVASEPKQYSQGGEVVEAVHYTTPHQPSQNRRDEDFTSEEGISSSSMPEPRTEENFEEGETPPPQDYNEGEVVNTTYG